MILLVHLTCHVLEKQAWPLPATLLDWTGGTFPFSHHVRMTVLCTVGSGLHYFGIVAGFLEAIEDSRPSRMDRVRARGDNNTAK